MWRCLKNRCWFANDPAVFDAVTHRETPIGGVALSTRLGLLSRYWRAYAKQELGTRTTQANTRVSYEEFHVMQESD